MPQRHSSGGGPLHTSACDQAAPKEGKLHLDARHGGLAHEAAELVHLGGVGLVAGDGLDQDGDQHCAGLPQRQERGQHRRYLGGAEH